MEHTLNIWNSFVKTYKRFFKRRELEKCTFVDDDFLLVKHTKVLLSLGLLLWSITKASIYKCHTRRKQDCFFENYLSRKTSNQAFNRHTPPFTVGSTTKVKVRRRHIQILKFWCWKRKPTSTRMSHSTHEVAQTLKKVGCSPQISDLSLKSNSSNYNSKVQLLWHNYCGGGVASMDYSCHICPIPF